MRKLTGKGIEALPDELGFWIYYRDGVKLSDEEVRDLTLEEIANATVPQTEEERREYYQDQQAEFLLEEMFIQEAEGKEEEYEPEYYGDEDL